MKTFLEMEVDQDENTIKLHLDYDIQQVLAEYKEYNKTILLPNKVRIAPGVILKPDVAVIPEQRKLEFYRSFIAKLRFAAT